MSNALRLVGTAALAGVVGCASGGGSLGPFASSDVAAYAQVLAAADARRADTSVFLAGTRASSVPLRRAATLAIGQTKTRAAAPALRALLTDADTGVAARAAFALGMLRDTASIPALEAALDGVPSVAVQAAFALGEIGEPARAAIVGHLRTTNDATAGELLRGAAKLRPVPAAEISALLSHSSACVRWAAAYALSRPRVAAGARALLASLQDTRTSAPSGGAGYYECSPAELRAQIARALTAGVVGDSLAASAMAALRRLASDAEPHVRINALRSLATFGDGEIPTLGRGAQDPDANVRIAAAQALAGRNVSAELWTALWRADTSLMFRRSLLESATRSGFQLAAQDDWLRASDWRMRAALADAAAGAPRVETLERIARPLLTDADPRVRQSAVAAVAAALDSASEREARRAAVLAAVEDSDFFVRATAILALADSARAAEVPAVLASYRLAARDSGNDARIAAIQYVANAWRRDSAAFADSALAALRALPPSDDPLVRAPARGVPPLAHWPGVEGVERPRGWYAGVVREYVVPTLEGRPRLARIVSERGPIELELLGEDAPLTVENFVRLARSGYYRNVRFHRVVPNFVAQDGDPRGDGNGGPGYAIRDELNLQRYSRGAVGMALSGPDTGGSQYFLTLSPQPHLDARYTIFARVVGGFDAMDALVQGDRISDIIIVR
ncbi:MAG TPA: peptidylprolyl isomerase [Gemmatimonadaceae bacterium]|nr:peptidylprolyl isomerase [Gemmatimonadaceae bacterium]